MRRTDWIQTYTGRKVFPLDMTTDDVVIMDIAHALSNQCRFAGHTDTFYSVAEHSVLVSHFLPDELKLWGLLHDASEAYLVDIPRPIKKLLPAYLEIEERVQSVIAERYGLQMPIPAEVKRIDQAILTDERLSLMGIPPEPWSTDGEPLGAPITGFAPPSAKAAFMTAFNRFKIG